MTERGQGATITEFWRQRTVRQCALCSHSLSAQAPMVSHSGHYMLTPTPSTEPLPDLSGRSELRLELQQALD